MRSRLDAMEMGFQLPLNSLEPYSGACAHPHA